MRTPLHVISTGSPGHLALMARPRGGDWLEDEVQGWRDQGVNLVVSLLTDDEVSELGLEREAMACDAAGIRFRRFPIPDRGTPAPEADARRLLLELKRALLAGTSVAIHCRMGIGRSALVAAAVLRMLGVEGSAALQRIAAARGLPVPDTEAQRAWVMELSL